MRRILAFAVLLLLSLGIALPAAADSAARTVSGLVTGSHGTPIAGVQVELIQLGVGTVATGTTTGDGTFLMAVAKVSLGPVYQVRAWAKGYALGQSSWSDLDRTAAIDLSLTPGTATLGGRVTNGKGAPVAGAAVELLSGTNVVASQVTDGTGTYTFADQVSSSYRVRVLAKGFTPVLSASVTAVGGKFTPVDVQLAAATGTFVGQVVDQQTGEPLVGAHLLVYRQSYGIVAQGDAGVEGRFSFSVPAAGEAVYKLIAWTDGHTVLQTPLTSLAPGGQVRYQGVGSLQLAPATGGLALWLNDYNGFVLKGVKVQLDRQGYGTIATALTDATGHVQFDGLRVGPNYRLRIFPLANSENTVQTDWTPVAAGGLSEFSLTMPAVNGNTFGYGTVTGRVTDVSGRPLAGATVDILRAGGGANTAATTDKDGRYSTRVAANKGDFFQNAPGYIVRVSRAGYVANDQFTVPAGRTASANGLLDVPRDGVAVANMTLTPVAQNVSGYVLDAQGQSLEGVKVRVWQQGDAGTGTAAQSDALGRYTLTLTQPDAPALIYAEGSGYVGAMPDAGTAPSANLALGALPNITLNTASASLTVRVTDSLGRIPAQGATVKAFVPVTGEWLSAATDSMGRAELTGLPVDGQALAVTALGEGYSSQALYPVGSGTAAATLTLQPSPGEQVRTTASLPAQTGTLGGGVFAADGQPLAGATVTLLQEGVGVVTTTKTDAGGHYWFNNLPAGPGARYVVRAEAKGYVSGSLLRSGKLITPTPLDAGGTIRMDLGLTPAQ